MRKRLSKILVTGGAGFIGSAFVRLLCNDRDCPRRRLSLIVVDNLTYAGDLARLAEVKGKYKFYKTDICNARQVDNIFRKEKPQIVAHFAAESVIENTYLPIYSVVGTRLMTFSELWEQQKENNKVKKTKNGEVIFMRGRQTKALSFYNGGQWMPIRAITRHWYKGKIVKLNQKWGIIEVTPNHSLYSANLNLTTPTENPEMLVVRNINENNKKYKKADRKLLKILAAYITEGNATFNKANGSYIVEINQSSKKWLEDIGKSIRKLLGINYSITKWYKESGIGYHLQVSNKEFFNYLIKNCGKYCDGKYFPNWIFDLNHKDREYFWQKLLEGDGTKDNRYTTTSYKLTNQISLLLALQNNKFTIHERSHPRYKKSWEFKIGLETHYGLCQKKKKEINYNGWVYDLEVEKTHNFVCGIGNVVCHNTHVDRSIKDSACFIETNIEGTHILLEASRKYGIEKFIHISTDEVYGDIVKGRFSEDSSLKPSSPYAASKAAADLLIKSYIRTYNFPAIIVRPSNNYGPWQYPEKFIPLAILKIIRDEVIPVYGNGRNVREWLYVDDCAAGILEILKKGKTGEIYNLGSSQEKENIEVARLLLRILGSGKDLVQFVKDRAGHDIRYRLNSRKVFDDTGWKPKVTFDKGLKFTAEWCINHKDWLLSKWGNNIAKLYK